MLSSTQDQRLAACARVLDPPARVVMTGAVAPEAIAAFRANAPAGVDVLVVPSDAPAAVEGPVDVLFVGPVAPYTAAAELFARWLKRVAPGGLLFVHGAFSAPPLTAALVGAVGRSRGWRYYGRDGDLAEYVRADLSQGERVLDGLAQLAQARFFCARVVTRRLRRRAA